MKTKILFFASIFALLIFNANSQTNTFPASGNVGIGTLSPGKTLDIIGTARVSGDFEVLNGIQYLKAGNATFFATHTGYNAGGASFWGVKNRGGIGTATQNNDGLLFMGGRAYDGVSMSGASSMLGFRASENWNSTSHGSYITFEVTPNGSTTRTQSMRITNDGNVGIGIGATHPSSKLDVQGDINIWSYNSYKIGGRNILRADNYYYNIYLGHNAGQITSMGSSDVFVGSQSGYNNTTGSENSFFGSSSGYSNTTGSYNSFVGYQSGFNNTTGSGNVFLGYRAGFNETGSNKLYIENSNSTTPLIYGEFDNDILRFNGDVGINAAPTGGYALYVNGTTYCTSGSWAASDARYKKNVKIISSALEKVKSMRGTNYEFNTNQFKNKKFSEEKQYGFIAQELKEVLPELVKQDEDGFYAVNYDGVIPVLVEAMKELEIKNTKLENVVEEQNSKIEEQDNRIESLEKILASNSTQSNTVVADGEAILYQNNPNPFNKQTEIQYFLSDKISSAAILIFDMNGKQLKSYKLTQRGNNKLIINGSEFTAGMYIYSLVADGKIIDTKKMILNQPD